MNRTNRSLHLVGSLAAALAGAAAVTGPSSPAEAQIVFDTAQWTSGASNPSSTATAISTFDGLTATTTPGYGCLNVTSLNGLNNQSVSGGGATNIAYHESVAFTVGPTQVGTWQFRWGPDFGKGGTLLVDGVELQSRWTDMWWSGSFSDPSQYLAGMANLTAGTHIAEVFGFEDCCDGPSNAQFMSPDSLSWRDISTANLNVVALPCGSASLLVTDAVSPNPVNDAMTVTYTLFYESTGTIATTAATLVQELSPALTFVSASNGGAYDPGTRHVTWSLGPLGPGMSGSVTVTATVDAGVPDQTSIVDLTQLGASNVSATATATSTVVVDNAAPMLTVGMTPDPVTAGDQLTVGLSYANGGSIDATNAILTDVIPANTTFVQAMAGGIYDTTTRTITWLLGSIPAHGGATVSYVVSVPNPVSNHTPLIDMASLVTDHTSTVTGHATAYTSSAPLLTFTDVPNANPVAAGAPLSYTLSWSNIGSDTANDSVIQWGLPAHVTFQTANNGGTYDSASNKVIWNVGPILSGSMGGVTVTVLVDSPLPTGTQLIDQAALLTSNGGMPMANTTVTVSSAPALVLTETGAPNPVGAGGQLVYTLAYGNGGSDNAQNAVIVAAVPANTTFVSATGGGTYDSGANSVTFALGALATNPNPLGSVTFTVKAASPLANGTTLTASAMLSADNATTAPAMATDTVQSAPTLSLTNTGMPSPIDPGNLLTYTIAYANNGTDAAHGVTITDALPSGVTIMSASNGGSYDSGTNAVTWSPSDLAAGASGSVTLTVLVNSSAPAGMLTDTAVLSASNIASPISAGAMTAVNAVVTTGAAGSSGTGAAGSSGTGAAGSSGTGAGGTSATGAGGTSATGAAGSSGTGVAGSSGTGSGGTAGAGVAGTSGSGAGGTSAAGTGGTSTAGGAGSAGTGMAGIAGMTGAGGASATGNGGNGVSTGGDSGAGAGGSSSSGAGGNGIAGAGGSSSSTGAGGSGIAGAGGGKATGGKGGSAQTGTAGSGQTNASGSGCDCAVASSPTPGSLLWLVPMAMVFTVTRRRRR